ncbi:cilia- and flagella-associated protein 337-like [Clytia hemisphaerica]
MSSKMKIQQSASSSETDDGENNTKSDFNNTNTNSRVQVPAKENNSTASVAFQQKAKIEDQMNNENLEQLQKIFEDADEDGGGGLDIEEFGQAMKMAFGSSDELDDEQLQLMFMKVDTNCDGTVDWEEFCSYMLLENQQKDSMTRDVIDLPFPNAAREIANPHHDSLAKITYFPSLGVAQRASNAVDSEELDNGNGRYISCSKDGLFVFWNLDLQIQRTINLNDMQTNGSKSKQIWVTDVVALANVKKVAVATTERDITFYDCSANSFEKQFLLTGLPHCVLCMDYWFNPQNMNEGVLVTGDAGGSVSCMQFTQATVGLFDVSIGKQHNMSTSTVRRIPFQELCVGRHSSVNTILFSDLHDDWVRKVKYIPNLQCFISCSNTGTSSLFLGDLQNKKIKSSFKIPKGVYSFDYDKENNIIVTGGLDRYIRLWNPYVTIKSTSVLKGHNSSVIHIVACADQIISFSKDKMIKIWDTRDHCCIQTIPSRLTDFGAHQITTVYYNRKLQTLLLGSCSIAVLEKRKPEEVNVSLITEEEQLSHPKPLCGALYNDLFNQVVSACHGSIVNVWHVDTGEKAIMFTNAHNGHEITSMTFDPTKRRLITGSRNGSVKIWNFNNGACLHSMNALDDSEVTGIVCLKQRIVTVGWNHKIMVYRDVRGAEDDPPKMWNNLHKDDILSVDHTKAGLMVTTSYDGQVCCWNIETAHVFCQMNVNDKRTRSNQGGKIAWNNRILPRRATIDLKPDDINKHLSVDKVIFLQNREQDKKTATLLVSVDGIIQAWSVQGGLLGRFDATGRRNDESILALKSDSLNHILFTGDSSGYIKIWDISDYCIKQQQTPVQTRSPSPLDQFSRKKAGNSLAGLLKRSTVDSFNRMTSSNTKSSSSKSSSDIFDSICSPPETLLQFRGHGKSIVSIDYCEKKQLIVTASTDCYVRLWTINGKYLGTFGQKQPWDSLENSVNLKKARRLPPDLQRIASTQTLKVVNGSAPRWKLARNIFTILHMGRRNTKSAVKDEDVTQIITSETSAINRHQILDIPIHEVLGKNYKPKQRHRMPPIIKPKINNLQCVAFSSLPFKELEHIEEPKMPQVLVHAMAARQQQQQQQNNRTVASAINGDQNRKSQYSNNRKGGTSPIRHTVNNRLLPAIAMNRNKPN